ncbi:MAG: CBS domain-containing protein [Deltaproteobacteria bacterium]|nr:MAG: CBS domain-containing protein [Deltaproteobacteria bacterium]
MRAKDSMSRQVETIDENALLQEAAEKMHRGGFHHLVVTCKGKICGVLSETDILRHRAKYADMDALRNPVSHAMTAKIVTISPDEPLPAVAAKLLEHRVSCLPVVEDGELLGLVTRTDIVRWVAEQGAHGALAEGA